MTVRGRFQFDRLKVSAALAAFVVPPSTLTPTSPLSLDTPTSTTLPEAGFESRTTV